MLVVEVEVEIIPGTVGPSATPGGGGKGGASSNPFNSCLNRNSRNS
jgi:hypothetical protein